MTYPLSKAAPTSMLPTEIQDLSFVEIDQVCGALNQEDVVMFAGWLVNDFLRFAFSTKVSWGTVEKSWDMLWLVIGEVYP